MGNFLISLLALSWLWLSAPVSAHLRQIPDGNSVIFEESNSQWGAELADDEFVRTLFAPEGFGSDRWNLEDCRCLQSLQRDRCSSADGASFEPRAHLNETLTLERVHDGKQNLSACGCSQFIAIASTLGRRSLMYGLPSPMISLAAGPEHKEYSQVETRSILSEYADFRPDQLGCSSASAGASPSAPPILSASMSGGAIGGGSGGSGGAGGGGGEGGGGGRSPSNNQGGGSAGNNIPEPWRDILVPIPEKPIPAVPEPSTWMMIILGFCGLGTRAYRKRMRTILGA